MILYLLVSGILAFYVLLIAVVTVGWFRLPWFKAGLTKPLVTVSVIVPLRNEAARLPALLHTLTSQQYPSGQMEILFVDDHSEDGTAVILQQYLDSADSAVRMRLVRLRNDQGFGKKAALHAGITEASGQMIITTDADCSAGSKWISTLMEFFEFYKPQMIQGPVLMQDNGSWFGKLQSLEFASLIASTAGSSAMGFPLMANGANMAFTKKAYLQCGGYSANMQFASGDDMFLLQSIMKEYGQGAVRFCRSAEAIVSTPAQDSLSDFISQRKRWVSKSRGYSIPYVMLSSVIIFLVNSCLLFTLVASAFDKEFLLISALLFVIKTLVDIPVMAGFCRFLGKSHLLWLMPLLELLNALYTAYIAIAGNIGNFTWKGRMHHKGRLPGR